MCSVKKVHYSVQLVQIKCVGYWDGDVEAGDVRRAMKGELAGGGGGGRRGGGGGRGKWGLGNPAGGGRGGQKEGRGGEIG